MVGHRDTVTDVVSATGFDAFYRSEYARTVRLARLLTGSMTAAEDLAQEAFVTVFREGSTLDVPAAFLRTATANLCRNWHRSRSRERRSRLISPRQWVRRAGWSWGTLGRSCTQGWDDRVTGVGDVARNAVILASNPA